MKQGKKNRIIENCNAAIRKAVKAASENDFDSLDAKETEYIIDRIVEDNTVGEEIFNKTPGCCICGAPSFMTDSDGDDYCTGCAGYAVM